MGLNFIEWTEFSAQLVASIVKILVVFLVMAHIPPLMVWVERRVPALMQRRKGPNRVGLFKFRLFGLMQPLADTIKLIWKEEVVPDGANKPFFHIAPIFNLFTSLLVAAAIPWGNDLEIAGYTIPLSIVRVDVGFLFIFAMSSLAVYGVTLAGWSSNNKYSLLGSLRSAAQMISYEIPLGLSLIPIVLIFGTLDINTVIKAQMSVAEWGIFRAPVSFVLFLIAMFAETNRAPFDLAEAEGELVAGFHTEYGSFKWSLFFFGEYVSMFSLSCLCSALFFGGWQVPFVSFDTLVSVLGGHNLAVLAGVLTMLLKGAFFMWIFVWVRWTLPRFRYDQLMSLGWKFMLPVGLANVMLTAIVIASLRHGGR